MQSKQKNLKTVTYEITYKFFIFSNTIERKNIPNMPVNIDQHNKDNNSKRYIAEHISPSSPFELLYKIFLN